MTDKAREIAELVRCVARSSRYDYSTLDDAADFIQSQSARIAELEARVRELESIRSELVLELIATVRRL